MYFSPFYGMLSGLFIGRARTEFLKPSLLAEAAFSRAAKRTNINFLYWFQQPEWRWRNWITNIYRTIYHSQCQELHEGHRRGWDRYEHTKYRCDQDADWISLGMAFVRAVRPVEIGFGLDGWRELCWCCGGLSPPDISFIRLWSRVFFWFCCCF